MRAYLLVNPRAGAAPPAAHELAAAAAARGIRVHVLARGENAAEPAARAEAGVLGVAGGDGTISSVADRRAHRR